MTEVCAICKYEAQDSDEITEHLQMHASISNGMVGNYIVVLREDQIGLIAAEVVRQLRAGVAVQ